MRTRLTSALIACLSLCGGAGALAAELQPGSVWKNERGSTLTITAVDSRTGVITGTFATGVGCGVGSQRPLTGVYNQGAFLFTVNFQECGSAATWAGVLDVSGARVRTLWHLARAGDPRWDSIVAGTDEFVRQ